MKKHHKAQRHGTNTHLPLATPVAVKIETSSATVDSTSLAKRDIYNVALIAARYEGTLLWQIFSVFLLIHTAIVGFIVQRIDAQLGAGGDLRVLIASVGGIALSLLWAATYSRNSSHYRYFLARARENEPAGWHLYGGSGKDFSHGKGVTLETQMVRLSRPARWVRSGRMIPPVICIFVLVYILGLASSSISCLNYISKIHKPAQQTLPASHP